MFDWFPERRTRLHLVPLKGGPVRTFEAPTYFTFHYINAFETADGRSLCFGARAGGLFSFSAYLRRAGKGFHAHAQCVLLSHAGSACKH